MLITDDHINNLEKQIVQIRGIDKVLKDLEEVAETLQQNTEAVCNINHGDGEDVFLLITVEAIDMVDVVANKMLKAKQLRGRMLNVLGKIMTSAMSQ